MRRIAMWAVNNIPVGRFAPYLFGYAISAKKWRKTDNKRLNIDGAKDRATS